jgi:hypothetical protein
MKRFDEQICLKLAGPLRAAVEADAAARERSVSWTIRKVLLAYYVPHITERASTDAGTVRGQA